VTRKFSIFSDPDFKYLIAVIFFFLLCAVYVGYKNSGIIAGIFAGLQGIYGIVYITLFLIFFVVVINKWEILKSILIQIGKWIWDSVTHKKRL
jgi:hypothetical protein